MHSKVCNFVLTFSTNRAETSPVKDLWFLLKWVNLISDELQQFSCYKCIPGEIFLIKLHPEGVPFWTYDMSNVYSFKLRPILDQTSEMYVKVITKAYPKYPLLNKVNVMDYDSNDVFERELCKVFVTFKISNDKMLQDIKEYLTRFPEYTYRVAEGYHWSK